MGRKGKIQNTHPSLVWPESGWRARTYGCVCGMTVIFGPVEFCMRFPVILFGEWLISSD